MTQTPIGTALFSQHCLDFDQTGVPELFDELARHQTALRIVQAGDQLRLDPEVDIKVLHPTPTVDDKNDNANSVVLQIIYAGKMLLLTGDLEKGGATTLLAQPLAPVDVLLAPHHGAKLANTQALAQWARPRHVVASCGRDITPALAKIYDQAESIHCTATAGAVQVRITPDGELSLKTYNKTIPSHPSLTSHP